jgi:hypothetical protein
MDRIRGVVVASVLAAAFLAGCVDEGKKITLQVEPPVIDVVTPDSADVGATVQIQGRNFGAQQGASSVLFGPVQAPETPFWSDTRIDAVVPEGASTGNLRVVVDDLSSNLVPIEITPPPPPVPVLTLVDPDSAVAGTRLHVQGLNFGATQGTSKVLFGDVEAVLDTWSNVDVHPLVPDLPEGLVDLKVVVGGVESNVLPFFVIVVPPPPGPVIDRLVPVRTFAGDTVDVVGSHFDDPAGRERGTARDAARHGALRPNAAHPSTALREAIVTFEGGAGRVPAEILLRTEGLIRVLVPLEAVDGEVRVDVDGSESAGVGFSVAPEAISYTGHLLHGIFEPKGCVSCHGGERNLFLDSAALALQGNSVNGPVIQPRHAEESLLVLKVLPDPPVGEQMPPGCAQFDVCLTEAQVLLIKDWINQGARDN